MPDSDLNRHLLLDQLATEFAERYRRGEHPALTEYIEKHPDLADEIREYFPAMVEIEVVKAAAEGTDTLDETSLPKLEHLGDFRILREIGHGGMGVVYEAEQVSLGRRVALKLLTQRMLRDGVQKRRFEREAKAAARLHHTNIVPVFGSGEHEGTPYYVMQYIHGLGLDVVTDEVGKLQSGQSAPVARRDVSEVAKSLMTGEFPTSEDSEHSSGSNSRAVAGTPDITVTMTQPGSSVSGGSSDRHRRKLTYWQGVARIGVQVADALEYAHRQGIIHRDVKPSNLLLDMTGTVWMTDFGLAKSDDKDNLTRTGDMLGTLRYMPPEAFDGKGDARGDVYGLGITLYEMLALRPAYNQHDRNKLIKAVTISEPPRLRAVRQSVPRDLETIVHKAIDREPNRRYHSAAELGADLQRFLNDEPIKARDISTHERVWRWCRRYPLVASLLATTFLVFLAGFAGVTWQWRVAEAARNEANITRNEAARQAAGLLLDRGIEDARNGEPTRAIHLFVRALQTLPRDDSTSAALERVIRANLAAWAETVPALERIFPGGPCFDDIAFSPDGAVIAMAIGTNEIQCIRTDTGLPVGPPANVPFGGWAAMEFAADGRTLWVTTHGVDKVVDQWAVHRVDTLTGRLVQPPILSSGPVYRLFVTPDGRYLVGAVMGIHPDERGPKQDSLNTRFWRTASVQVWETASGRVVRNVEVNAEREFKTDLDLIDTYLSLSPDGQFVTAWVQRGPKRFEGMRFTVDGSEPAIPTDTPPVGAKLERSLHFENNMRSAHVIMMDQLHRWSAKSPFTLGPGVPTPFRAMCDAPSADGRTIVSATEGRVFDAGIWPPRPTGARFTHPGWQIDSGPHLDQSPDGRFAVTWTSFGGGGGRLWRLPRQRSRPARSSREPPMQPARDYHLFGQFDSQAQFAVLGPIEQNWNSKPADASTCVRIVEARSGAVRTTTVHHSFMVRDVAFTPDGRHFATASWDGSARVWETASGRPAGPALRHDNYVSTVAFSPDGNTLAAGDYGPAGLIKLWDWRTGREIRPPFRHDDIILYVSFSPDGRYVAAIKTRDWSSNPELLVWDIASGTAVVRLRHCGPNFFVRELVRFRSDSRAISTRDINGVLRVWEIPSGKVLGECPLDGDGVSRWAPNGRFVAATANLGVRLLDGESLEPLPGGYLPHPDSIKDLAFSPDGSLLLTGHHTGTAQLWDVATRKPIGPPAVLIGTIRAVSFSTDGKLCICVAADGTIRRWPVPAPIVEPDVDHLADRVALMTGQRLGDNQGLDAIPADEWRALRARFVGNGSTALVSSQTDEEWHDNVASDAEQDGDEVGAEWHLARLAKLRPQDWTIPARRGRVFAAARRYDEAAMAYAAAVKLSPSPQAVSDWLRGRAAYDQAAQRTDAAIWNLDRAIALIPDDWTLYAARAQLEYKNGQADRGAIDVDEMVRRGADDVGTLFQVAECAGGKGDWKRAAALFHRLGQTASLSLDEQQRMAILYLKSGDSAGYRLTCLNVPVPPLPDDPKFKHYFAYLSASLFTLGPDATSDWSKPISWIDQGLARLAEIEKEKPGAKEQIQQLRNKYVPTRGALLYRAGRFEEAAVVFREAVAQTQIKEFRDWAFLALAERRLGHDEAARKAAATARTCVKPTAFWEHAELELLAKELDAALTPAAK